jgi:hypothetical protein
MATKQSPAPKIVSNATKLRKRLSTVSDEKRVAYLDYALSVGKKADAKVKR